MERPEVLVVDDDPEVGGLIAEMAQVLGFRPRLVPDASSARKWLSSSAPKLVLADIMMPDENGLDFLKWFRGEASLRDVPFFVLSALSDEETVQDALALGASDFIRKPLTLGDLKAKLRRFLPR